MTQYPDAASAAELATQIESTGQKSSVPDYKRTYKYGLIPRKRQLTPAEQLEYLVLDAAKQKFNQTGDIEPLLELRKAPPEGTDAPHFKDPLDAVRVGATLIMVLALFFIVWEVALRDNPSESSAQLVSLASGLAGIGLGWLFGGVSRGKNE